MSGERFDYFGVVAGVASLYGAWISWQQRRGATIERKIAADAAAQAKQLVRLFAMQRLFADCIHHCRSAHAALGASNRSVCDHLTDAVGIIARLSGEAQSKSAFLPAAWRRMDQDMIDLVATIRELGSRAMSPAAQGKASASILHIISELERGSAGLSSEIGAN